MQALNSKTNRIVTLPDYIVYRCGFPVLFNDITEALKYAKDQSEDNRDVYYTLFSTVTCHVIGQWCNGEETGVEFEIDFIK